MKSNNIFVSSDQKEYEFRMRSLEYRLWINLRTNEERMKFALQVANTTNKSEKWHMSDWENTFQQSTNN
jgi:hypothetical protein